MGEAPWRYGSDSSIITPTLLVRNQAHFCVNYASVAFSLVQVKKITCSESMGSELAMSECTELSKDTHTHHTLGQTPELAEWKAFLLRILEPNALFAQMRKLRLRGAELASPGPLSTLIPQSVLSEVSLESKFTGLCACFSLESALPPLLLPFGLGQALGPQAAVWPSRQLWRGGVLRAAFTFGQQRKMETSCSCFCHVSALLTGCR